MMMDEQMVSDEAARLTRQFTVRRWLLQALGLCLIVVALEPDETIIDAWSSLEGLAAVPCRWCSPLTPSIATPRIIPQPDLGTVLSGHREILWNLDDPIPMPC